MGLKRSNAIVDAEHSCTNTITATHLSISENIGEFQLIPADLNP